jgi:hypothetical protein
MSPRFLLALLFLIFLIILFMYFMCDPSKSKNKVDNKSSSHHKANKKTNNDNEQNKKDPPVPDQKEKDPELPIKVVDSVPQPLGVKNFTALVNKVKVKDHESLPRPDFQKADLDMEELVYLFSPRYIKPKLTISDDEVERLAEEHLRKYMLPDAKPKAKSLYFNTDQYDETKKQQRLSIQKTLQPFVHNQHVQNFYKNAAHQKATNLKEAHSGNGTFNIGGTDKIDSVSMNMSGGGITVS